MNIIYEGGVISFKYCGLSTKRSCYLLLADRKIKKVFNTWQNVFHFCVEPNWFMACVDEQIAFIQTEIQLKLMYCCAAFTRLLYHQDKNTLSILLCLLH